MYKNFSAAVISVLIGFSPPAFAVTIYTGDIASKGAALDNAIVANGGMVYRDVWDNPVWETNSTGNYTGTPNTPFIFFGMQRNGYSVEKGLIPLGISGHSIILPQYQTGQFFEPMTIFSPLNGQAMTLNPDTLPVGGPDIYSGFHPGIEYGLVFKFKNPINAFGLEFNVEAHNSVGESTIASMYYALDDGPAHLISGPFDLTVPSNGASTEVSSLVGIIEKATRFSTVTFFTDGPRDSNGSLMAFYNAYAGGTIHYGLANVSAVPEVPRLGLLVAGFVILATTWRRRQAGSVAAL